MFEVNARSCGHCGVLPGHWQNTTISMICADGARGKPTRKARHRRDGVAVHHASDRRAHPLDRDRVVDVVDELTEAGLEALREGVQGGEVVFDRVQAQQRVHGGLPHQRVLRSLLKHVQMSILIDLHA